MHKYFAEPTTVDGVRFASKAEAKRYGELLLLQKAKLIHCLVLQPVYPLLALGGERVGLYMADFEYIDTPTDVLITEDVKGMLTPMYRWKKRHFEAQYGRRIVEVRA